MPIRKLASPLLCLLLLAPLDVAAEDVVVGGVSGPTGAAGADGDPPETGGPGSDGADASALADAPAESNEAVALGGDGGDGGPGGDAPDAGTPAGAGGIGGAGGDATAEAVVTGAPSATATATGGDAGDLGADGSGADPLPLALDGSPGGAATATATLDYDGPDAAAVTATATGGTGGRAPEGTGEGGAGGNATATATGEVADGSLVVSSQARGGEMIDGTGGDAVSNASGAAAGGGDVTVEALASGGFPTGNPSPMNPGPQASTAGGAQAEAFGQNAGSGDVEVTAHAQSSPGNPSAQPVLGVGPLAASAEGHSLDGDVRATASVALGPVSGGGPVTELHDAASGSTAGALTLIQLVRSASGEMASSLTATNPGGGDLHLGVSLTAFDPLLPFGVVVPVEGDSADVIVGDVVATSSTGSNVSVDVVGLAGTVTDGAAPAGVVLQNPDGSGSVIHGSSDGGAVTVGALLGAGGSPARSDLPMLDPGGSIELVNVVTGETSGDLALGQFAMGGTGGSAGNLFLDPFYSGGGDAYSELTKATSSSSLQLGSFAQGGMVLGAAPGKAPLAEGGDAHAVSDAFNDAGSVEVITGAQGGSGDGGDALVEAHARTTGDGNDVRVLSGPVSPFSGGIFGFGCFYDSPSFFGCRFGGSRGATGGNGGNVALPIGVSHVDLPDGGDATSSSVGIAEGDSLVEVRDQARAGRGGSTASFAQIPGTTGDGGNANSEASARGGGVSDVSAHATAIGGAGGDDQLLGVRGGGFGGDATAHASATGLGAVEAIASALGGRAGNATPEGVGGTALATATAAGASGIASAHAEIGTRLTLRDPRTQVALGATATAEVASQADVQAGAAFGAPLPAFFSDLDREAGAFATAHPTPDAIALATSDNAALASILDDHPGARVRGIGSFEAIGSEGAASSARSISLDITLPDADAERSLQLAAFDISFMGDGFASLTFRIEKDGDAFGDEVVFDDVGALIAYFENAALDLGPGTGLPFDDLDVSLFFDLTLGEDDAFGMRVAYAAVPEPGTGALLALGLIVLSRRRRRRA